MFSKSSWWMILRGHGEPYLRQLEGFFTGASPVFRHVPAQSSAVLPFNKILAILHLTYVRYITTGPGGPFGPVVFAFPCGREAPAAFFIILLIFALRMLRLSSVLIQQIEYFT